jgi:hypothetical protein
MLMLPPCGGASATMPPYRSPDVASSGTVKRTVAATALPDGTVSDGGSTDIQVVSSLSPRPSASTNAPSTMVAASG